MRTTGHISAVAKLMATENLVVEHNRNARTASMNLKTRVLTLPVWKDIGDDLYDMLISHEISHALHTPLEGWHKAVTYPNRPGFHGYLNVVEDARIERMVKEKYPGTKRNFMEGYKELLARDFFEINNVNLRKLPLIDRVNLYFKCGSLLYIEFTSEEQKLVNLVERADTFAAVVKAAEALYEFSKEKNERQQQIQNNQQRSQQPGEPGDEQQEEAETETSKEEASDETDEEKEGEGECQEQTEEEGAAESITDEAQRRNEESLVQELDEKNRVREVLVGLPKGYKVTDYIVKADILFSRYHASLRAFGNQEAILKDGYAQMKDFLKANRDVIHTMVNEFEMRKNARQMATAQTSRTGKVDVNKLAQYKLIDDVFKRNTHVEFQQNHGMILFFDQSGSIKDMYGDLIRQVVLLCEFCRQLNIPFEVYGFHDRPDYHGNNHPRAGVNELNTTFSGYSMASLRQYLTSSMGEAQYNRMLGMLGVMAKPGMQIGSEMLNGTPLNSSIIHSVALVEAFKKAHNVDVMNVMFVTDGYTSDDLVYKPVNAMGDQICRRVVAHGKVSDGFIYAESGTAALAKMAREITGANYIGLFVPSSRSGASTAVAGARRWTKKAITVNREAWVTEQVQEEEELGYQLDFGMDTETRGTLNREGFVLVENCGFNGFFVLRPLKEVEDETLDSSTTTNKRELKNAFVQIAGAARRNRAFLNVFSRMLASSLNP